MSTPSFPPLNTDEKRTLFQLCRHAAYIAVQLVVVFALWGLGAIYKEDLIEEYGVLENLQLVTLGITAAVLLGEAACHARYRAILFALSMCIIAAFIRELDAFFDAHLPIISWKFCFLFPILGLAALWKQIHRDRVPLFEFFRSSSFGIMLMAFVTIVPLAQCIGHRHFVIDVLGTEEDPRLIRRFLEEPFELMGYLQLLLASVEFYFERLRRRSH